MDQYDEWGNYIGELSDEDEDQQGAPMPSASRNYDDEPPLEGLPEPEEEMEVDDIGPSNAVVLHDDKKYYPLASELYGADVETLVEEEDAQPLTEPIIAPIEILKFSMVDSKLGETKGPDTLFDKQFLLSLMAHPDSVRNVAVVGHLHHGKTALLDMLMHETHAIDWDVENPLRYTDTHMLAQKRGVSLKSSPLSLVLPSTRGKSYLVNVLDTPGHVNFLDESAAALRLVDGAVVVVDAVEGVLISTEKLLRHLVAEKLPFVLVLNKVDRLILELRLPAADAYYKLKHTIEEVNTVLSSLSAPNSLRVSPELGNVAFAAASYGWCFTLRSFASMYADTYSRSMDIGGFAKRLWGDIYFDTESRKFLRKGSETAKRSFVHFILEPLYKLYSQVLGADQSALKQTLSTLNINLKPALFKLDVRPLLKIVLSQFFGAPTGLVDMLAEHIPDPITGGAVKAASTWTGPLSTEESHLYSSMVKGDPNGPLVIHVTKLYPNHDASEFRAFGRVLSGVARRGESVRVLGEGYSPEDEEDMTTARIEAVFISESRYVIETDGVPAGNLVLISGIDHSISKTATIISAAYANKDVEQLHIFRPLKHVTQSVLKLAIEPLNPSELPKVLEGLRKLNKTYPLLETRVEESGEHVILGTGELYLDAALYDLREIFSRVEVKVSDPVVRFCETVVDTSAIKCYAETPNKKNKLTMICEPLEKGIADDIEAGLIDARMPPKELGKFLQERYQWDTLASRSVWAFGPEDGGPNVLVDDTIPGEVDKKLLASVREHIKQGFQWGTREGPICDEPIRNVKFRLTDVSLAEEPIYRGGGQIIPTARRVCYAAFMMATPRLMEPVYYVEVQAPADCVSAVYTVLARRRGHVTQDIPKPGSPLYTVKAYIPVIDSGGFETDLRTHTQGQAFCQQIFDHWSIVPGDPTDRSIVLRPLEPASAQSLARDMALKTRRRKGLGDNMSVAKYIEADLVSALVAAGQEDILG